MLHGVVAPLLSAYAPQLMLQATSDAQSAMAAATAVASAMRAAVADVAAFVNGSYSGKVAWARWA